MKSALCMSCGNLGSYRCNQCYNAGEYAESKTIRGDLAKQYLEISKPNSNRQATNYITNENPDKLCINCKFYPTKAQPISYMCIACSGHKYFTEKEQAKEVMKPSYQIYKPKEVKITNVIFNNPATIVFWSDGTKTVVKAQDENFDPEKGLAMAIAKKALGNKGNYFNEIKKWVEPYEEIQNNIRLSFSEYIAMTFGRLYTDGLSKKDSE